MTVSDVTCLKIGEPSIYLTRIHLQASKACRWLPVSRELFAYTQIWSAILLSGASELVSHLHRSWFRYLVLLQHHYM